jgi:hypothetical protein
MFKQWILRELAYSVADITVRAHPGRVRALSVSHSKSVLHGGFVWGGGRLTALNGGFRPGQMWTGLYGMAFSTVGSLVAGFLVKPLAAAGGAGGGGHGRCGHFLACRSVSFGVVHIE